MAKRDGFDQMKKFFPLLVFLTFAFSGVSRGDSKKERDAYISKINAIFKIYTPTMRKFGVMMNKEKEMRRQVINDSLSPSEYKARAIKSAEWLAIIGKVRGATQRFAVIKPVPSSMRAAHSQFLVFSSSTDKGLGSLKKWVYNRSNISMGKANMAFDIALESLDKGVKLLSDK